MASSTRTVIVRRPVYALIVIEGDQATYRMIVSVILEHGNVSIFPL